MKISIALCTYNGERFLREQLDSIMQQTLLPDELVVCDDCSKDSTIEVLKTFSERVPFSVHIHHNENNLGSTKNFEKAINFCTGDIIALCDQDDIWKPYKLERLVEALQKNPEAGYAFSDADLVDEHLQPLGFRLWDSIGFMGKLRQRFFKGEQFQCFIRKRIVTGATMVFRASVGKLAIPFPADGNWIHDGWIALIASATGAKGIPIEEPLISYRQHSKQQIGAPVPKKRKSPYDMYQELKRNNQSLFEAWEKQCLKFLELKDVLLQLQEHHRSSALEQSLSHLQEFITHFQNRRKILTSKSFGRYPLIFKEAFSGRYAEFSDSWRSMFRDLFL